MNFNEIQHSTWLGTFWTYVYKYTHKSKYTKNISIHCDGLHLFSSKLDYRPGPFSDIKESLLYSSFHIWNIRFSSRRLVSIILPEYLISIRCFIGLLDFYQKFHLSTWFLPGFFASTRIWSDYFMYTRFPYVYQNFIGVPDFLTSNRTSSEYSMYTRFPYI